jgi:hypothetical protein
MNAEETLAEYVAAHQQVISLAAEVPPERFQMVGLLPWYGNEYALDDYIVYAVYGHKREHIAEVNVYRDRIKAQYVGTTTTAQRLH